MFSCSRKPKNINLIPEEANVVAVVDLYSILKKSKLEDLKDLDLYKAFRKNFRGDDKKLLKSFEDIVEDPSVTGIDLKSDIFSFVINEDRDERFLCFSAVVDEKEVFSEFIEDFVDDLDLKEDTEEKELYQYMLIENRSSYSAEERYEAAIAWDENKVVFLFPMSYSSKKNVEFFVEDLMELKGKDQLIANEKFDEFYSNKKDISLWLSSNLFEDERDFKQLQEVIDIDIEDNAFCTYLSFNDNEISIEGTLQPNKEILKLIEDNSLFDKEFNQELLNYLPKTGFITSSIALNMDSYYNLLKENEFFDKANDEVNRELEIDIKDVFKSFKGSFVGSLHGVEEVEYKYIDYQSVYNPRKSFEYNYWTDSYEWEGGYEMKEIEVERKEIVPLMSFVCDLNNSKLLNKLFKMNSFEEGLEKKGDYYEFKFDRRFPAYVAFNNTKFFITNDKNLIKNFSKGGLKKGGLKESEISSDIEKNNIFAYMNLNFDDYPKILKKNIDEDLNRLEEKVFDQYKGLFKSITFEQNDNLSFELRLKLQEKDDNSLKVLIDSVDDFGKNLF